MLLHDGENGLQTLMVELGHKMPVYCRSLLQPDHEITHHLQFTDAVSKVGNTELNLLPVERVLSPFLVLVVCEKIYEDFSLVDNGDADHGSANCSENIYALYNQVLTDFDCLISLLTGLIDDIAINLKSFEKDDSNSSAPGNYDQNILSKMSCTAKLHRRTILIIEDICTLIGMRLATLDVLNSLDREDATSGTTSNAIRTLDRIIACTKSIHSKHTAPLIQRAAVVARAVRTYIFAKRALLGCKYADTTILMFDFKQLLKSLEVNPSAASSAGSQSLRYGSRKANHDSEFCPDKCSSNKKNGVPKSSSDNSEGMTDRENMKPIDSNEESDKVNQDLSTNYLKKTATCKLLGNLLANLKNMHSIMFEEVLNQTSTLLNSPSSAHADERKGAEAASRSATETSYVGGILDQASSYLPGMPTQGLGSFEDPPLYMTRLSSTSTSSNSSCSSASPECGRPTEVNRYNFSKSNAAQSEVSSRYGLQSAEVLRGFVCPIRSEWSKSGPDH